MKALAVAVILIVGLVGQGCKKKATANESGSGSTEIRYISTTTPLPSGPTTNPNPNGGANDPYVFYVDLAANQEFETPEIHSDNILDVVFVPSTPTGSIHAYTKLGVKICVNGRCDITPPSRIAEASKTFDFKDRISHGKVKVKLSNPVYDFYCRSYGLACPYKSMYDPRAKTDWARVRWSGRLIIGTNDTRRVEDALYNRYDENQYLGSCYPGMMNFNCLPGYAY